MDWIKMGEQIPRIHPQQMVVIAQFEQGLSVVINSYVGDWEEVIAFRRDELYKGQYTHYMLVNKPKF